MNQKNKGFTLIELLVVVAIISLLTSVTLASLSTAKKRAQDTKTLSELRQIQTAMEMYYNENGKYPTAPVGTYCIGGTNCLLAGAPAPGGKLSSSPDFTYKPSTSFSIGSGSTLRRGFLYTVPAGGGAPSVLFALNNGGVLYQVAGVWKTTSSN